MVHDVFKASGKDLGVPAVKTTVPGSDEGDALKVGKLVELLMKW